MTHVVANIEPSTSLLNGAVRVGYGGSAIVFLFAGAPDVAFTQVAVETVFVIAIAAMVRVLQVSAGARASVGFGNGSPRRSAMIAASH